MNLEVIHGFGGGGSNATDDISRVFEIEAGQTLASGDVVEFVGNKVKKTTKVINPSGGSAQNLYTIPSVNSLWYVYKYADDKGIIFNHNDGTSAYPIVMRTFELVGTVINIKQTLVPNLSGHICDSKMIDNNTLAVIISGGYTTTPYLNNTYGIWMAIFRLENDQLTFLKVTKLPQYLSGSYQYPSPGGTNYNFLPIGPRKVLILGYCAVGDNDTGTQYRGVTMVCIIDSNNVAVCGTLLYLSVSYIHSSVSMLEMSNGKIYGFLGGNSTGARRFVQLQVNADDTVTAIQNDYTTINQPNFMVYGVKLLEIDSQTLVLCSTNFNVSTKPAIQVIRLDTNGVISSLGTMLQFGILYSPVITGGFTQPDVIDKSKILLLFPYGNNIHSFIFNVNMSNFTITAQADVVFGAVGDIVFTRSGAPNSYPIFNIDSNLSIMFSGNGTAPNITFEAYTISTHNAVQTLATTLPHKPEAVVKSVIGQNARISVNNSIISGLSGLVPKTDYYCDEFGNLTSSTSNGNYPYLFVGKAISESEMLLFDLQKLSEFSLRSQNVIKRQYPGTVTSNRVVKLNSDGTVSDYDGTGAAIGLHTSNNIVTLKGLIKGLSGLVFGSKYWFGANGALTTTDLGAKVFAGYAISETELIIPDYIFKKFKGV